MLRIRRENRAVGVAVLAGMLTVLAGLRAEETLRISGSDLLGPVLQPLLQREAAVRGWDLSLRFDGSLSTADDLAAGEAELVLLARPEATGPADGTMSWPLAFEVTVVAVHDSNPVREASLPTLGRVFSAAGDDAASQWAALGAADGWQARPIQFHVHRDREHLNLELFRARVLAPRELRRDLRRWTEREAMEARMAEEVTAIGVLPWRVGHPQLRALRLASGEDRPAFDPSPQAVFYGDYPLQLAFHLVFPADRSSTVDDILGFLYGESVSRRLEEAGYMSVPPPERERFRREIEASR